MQSLEGMELFTFAAIQILPLPNEFFIVFINVICILVLYDFRLNDMGI